jgi:chaperonin GroEL (HSP60 family)
VADPQTLLQNKEEAEEKLAITDYELRLAQEDITKLKVELQTKTECNIINDDATIKSSGDVSVNRGGGDGELQTQQQKGNNQSSFADLGPVKDTERRDLNCAVKEYLLIAGYRLTAMTFYEEVSYQYHSS